MPLVIQLGIVAVVVAAIFVYRRRGLGRTRQFAGTAVAVWVGLIAVALVVLTLGTLIFGR